MEEGIVMKTIFRFLSLAVLIVGFIAVGHTIGFAQDPCTDTDGQAALNTKFTENYAGDLAKRKVAVESGKQFLEKYGACATTKEFSDYLKSYLPGMEKRIKDEEVASAKKALTDRFDTAIKGKNWDEAYAAGNEFITKFPDDAGLINKTIPLGMIGYYESFSKNYKYNNDTVKYAKMSLDQLRSGAKPKSNGNYGAFQFDCAKDDCISQLTYGLGYINYYAQDNKKAALPYFYEVTKLPGVNQKNAAIYATIGDYYFIDVKRLADEVQAKIKALSPSDPEDVKAKKDAEIKATIALLNGYSERALDAYARAYSYAKTGTPAEKTYRDSLYKQIESVYNVRTGKKDGVDAWISSAVAKPLPDPTSAVTPVSDPEPAADSTTSAPVTTTPATTVKPAPATPTKPAPTVTAKPTTSGTSSVTATPSSTTTAVKVKPVVKPVVKRKPTR